MGSNSSKPTDTSLVLKTELELGNSDPRSPTPEITRTPLQGKNGAKHNITKNIDLRKTFESTNGDEKLIHNNPILSAVIKNHLQSYDPRSPTQDFERTPIIISSKINDLTNDTENLRLISDSCASPVTSKDKDNSCETYMEAKEFSPDLIAPKNLCNGFLDSTFNDTLQDNEEPLRSSTASKETLEANKSNENKPIKLLETNFDCNEVCDIEFNSKRNSMSNPYSTEVNDSREQCMPVFKILEYDPRSPSIGIERTPLVVPKIDDNDSVDNVEEMSDDTLLKVLQKSNVEIGHGVEAQTNSDGLLVYEDESTDLQNTPKKSKSSSNDGSRTPLSCMKNKADTGHTRSKSANTVFDPKGSDIKHCKKISHIPRLKSLSKQSKILPAGSSISLKNISKASIISGDCENTPPHSHRDRWDKDSSVVL